MKSKLFAEFDPRETPDFERDLRRALTLSPSLAQTIAGEAGEFFLTRTERTRDALAHDISRKTTVPLTDVRAALKVFAFFLRMLTQDKFSSDRPEDLFDDLLDSEFVVREHRATFISAIETVKMVALASIEDINRARTGAGITPSLELAETTVELRGVIKPDFEVGDRAETYEPRIMGFVPVVSVRIQLDRGQPNDICFQCDEFQWNLLLEHLQATNKEFTLLKKELKSIESSKASAARSKES
jgi:hypothetical protein